MIMVGLALGGQGGESCVPNIAERARYPHGRKLTSPRVGTMRFQAGPTHPP